MINICQIINACSILLIPWENSNTTDESTTCFLTFALSYLKSYDFIFFRKKIVYVQRLWNFSTGKFLKAYKGHTKSRYAISATFSVTNGKYIVSGSEDNCVYLWDLQSRKIAQRLDGHKDIVVSVSCHPILNIIASGAFEKDCTVKIWIQRDEDQMDIWSNNWPGFS